MMKKLVKSIGVASMFVSVSALAHSGHQHHVLQSSSHAVTDTMLVLGAVVVAAGIVGAFIRRNES